MNQFKVGDYAVYPGHGVGRVSSVDLKEIMGSRMTFYSVTIQDSGVKVMIPSSSVKSVGLRPLASKDDVKEVLDILKNRKVKADNQTWNRRYRDYTDKIKTGSVVEIAKVLRDLSSLKSDKELSFGENKMLETARNLILKELNLAKDLKELVCLDAEARNIFGL